MLMRPSSRAGSLPCPSGFVVMRCRPRAPVGPRRPQRGRRGRPVGPRAAPPQRGRGRRVKEVRTRSVRTSS
nr:hypothetical protein [Human alphaherpesvirus 2]